MEELNDIIQKLKYDLNKRFKYYSWILIIIYLVGALIYFIKAFDSMNDAVTILESNLGIILVLFWLLSVYYVNVKYFEKAEKEKENKKEKNQIQNEKLSKRKNKGKRKPLAEKLSKFIVFDFFGFHKYNKTLQVNLFKSTLVFLSFVVYLTICYLPWFLFKDQIHIQKISLFFAYFELSGYFLFFSIATLVLCYAVILLPVLIIHKIEDNEDKKYSYIYWFYFLLHKVSSSPVLIYLLLPLFIISSLILIVIPSVVDEITSFRDFLEKDTFSIVVTSFGVWITSIIIIITELLKDFYRIYRCYEDYATYQLHNLISLKGSFKTIIIGFGNLSKVINGFLLTNYFINKNDKLYSVKKGVNRLKIFKKMKSEAFLSFHRYFEFMIDKNLKIRVIPKNIMIIEKEKALFEEIRIDDQSGFSFGFFNGSESINSFHNKLPTEIAVLGICGTGSSLSLLKELGFDNANYILNTSSDLDMGLKLEKIIESHKTKNNKPILITTVEDSTSYSFLESISNSSVYPLHTGRIEGTTLGNRLFMFYNKTLARLYGVKKGVIVGNGKSIYYLIDAFRRNLQIFNDAKTVVKIIESLLCVVTTDRNIIEECNYVDENIEISNTQLPDFAKEYLMMWNLTFLDGESVRIPVIHLEPTKFKSVELAYQISKAYGNINLTPNQTIEMVFVVTTTNAFDSLRVTEQVKQLSSVKANKGENVEISVIISTVYENINEIKRIIDKLPSIESTISKNEGFPYRKEDLIIRKNEIIGRQFASIMGIGLKKLEAEKKLKNAEIKSAEIAFCHGQEPLSYLKVLATFSGFKIDLKGVKIARKIPSFYYNYSYPLITSDNKLNNTFIIRADSYIDDQRQEVNFDCNIYSNHINSFESVKNEMEVSYNKAIFDIHKNCGNFNQRCPMSFENIIDKKLQQQNLISNIAESDERLKSLATIKIWSDRENVPGSIVFCLADFFMVKKYFKLNIDEKFEIFHILYETAGLCSISNNSISRIYAFIEKFPPEELQESKINSPKWQLFSLFRKTINWVYSKFIEENKFESHRCTYNKDIKEIEKNGNIIAIKIKPMGKIDNDVKWKNYCSELVKYLNDNDTDTNNSLKDNNTDNKNKVFKYILQINKNENVYEILKISLNNNDKLIEESKCKDDDNGKYKILIPENADDNTKYKFISESRYNLFKEL